MTYPFSYHYECTYDELVRLSTFPNSRKKLTYQQSKILQLAAARRRISSLDLSRVFPYSKKPMDYGNAKTNLRKLLDMNLLEHDQSIADSIRNDNKSKKIKYYRLSEYGIYNLISNNRNLQFDIAKPLLLNCKDHILFGFFLFPYIKEDTLSRQEIDSLIFSEIFSYLHDCCKHLEQMIFDINHTGNQINGYLTRQLFVWANVPQIDSDRENLRNFLKRTFNLDWLNNARIEKPDDNCITASYGLNTIMIRIDRDLKRVTLSFRGRKKSELVARELTDGQFVTDVVLAEQLQVTLTTLGSLI